ncbi:MAG: ATP-binding protein [Simkaniaceae bacterium]|nr:ATP-binding protein [Simkaniaceae bacterium]MCF7852990.1 ATP-binding protein [Simkaniaceae bacterium]
MIHRKIYDEIVSRLKEPRQFIQVLLGPRQVGKTTMSLQIQEHLQIPIHYNSADIATLEDLSWIETQWQIARDLVKNKGSALLIVDEIQKIPRWSSLIKKLWDEDSKTKLNLKVIILGSSPWLMQKGLSESLAGRFEILPVTHWSFQEMQAAFSWDIDTFIFYGGYPGPASLIQNNQYSRWENYINDSLIETTISRDILLMTQVNKPILLRRLFQLGCIYSSQILSFQKMLGQLDDAGNTTTLAHYLELLSGAGLLTGISKFTSQKVRSKGSSPKLQVLNTALMSAQSGKTLKEAKEDKEYWGRLVESAVGAYLLNQIRGTQIELFYWREKNQEVDFILKKGKKIIALEVKSSLKKEALSGMNTFIGMYEPFKALVIGNHGIPIQDFLCTPIDSLF